MVESKSSLVCSKVVIDNKDAEVEFRKAVLDMKSNAAVVQDSVIQNIKMDPVGSEQVVSIVGETIGESSIVLEGVQILSVEDVKLAASSETVNTHLLRAEAKSVKLSSLDLQDISVTSGLAIESEGKMELTNLKLTGTKNNLRKGLLKMNGGAVSITDSSFENISIDPVSEELLLESKGSKLDVQNLSMTNIVNTKVRDQTQTQTSQLWKINHDTITLAAVTLDTLELTSGMEMTAE